MLLAVGWAIACEVPRTHLQATHRAWSDSGVFDAADAADVGDAADAADAKVPATDAQRDSACQQSHFDLTSPEADVMLVVERSSVMNTPNDPNCSACGTYWSTLLDALKTLVNTSSANFRWGLKLFPSASDGDACLVTAAPEIPLTSDASAISAALASTTLGGATPSTMAVRQTAAYFASVQSASPKMMVLAMAGTPTCASADPSQDDTTATQTEVGRSAFKPVFVLGPGPSQSKLDLIARAGSAIPRYPTDGIPYLQAVMRSVSVMSSTNCSFPLPSPLLPEQSVNVLLDDVSLPMGLDGFLISPDQTQVMLQGPYCYNLGLHSNLVIKMGCGG